MLCGESQAQLRWALKSTQLAAPVPSPRAACQAIIRSDTRKLDLLPGAGVIVRRDLCGRHEKSAVRLIVE